MRSITESTGIVIDRGRGGGGGGERERERERERAREPKMQEKTLDKREPPGYTASA